LPVLVDALELAGDFDAEVGLVVARLAFFFAGRFAEVRGGSASVVTARKPTTTMPASSE